MFDALAGRIRIVTNARPDAGNFVGRHRSAHPAAADEQCALAFALDNCFADGFGKIRIIHRTVAICAFIDDVMFLVAA